MSTFNGSHDLLDEYLIPWRRCRLCLFPLQDGELVAGVDPRSLAAISDEFLFMRDTEIETPFGFRFSTCNSGDEEDPGFVACVHSICRGLHVTARADKFLAATKYDFELTPAEEHQRESRLTHLVAAALATSGRLPSLPVELWLLVAAHLLSEYTVTSTDHHVRSGVSEPSVLDVSRHVYATYTTFCGRRYLSTLRNSTRGDLDVELVLDAKTDHPVKSVYLLVDCLGVREVYFMRDNGVPSHDPSDASSWWRRVDITSQTNNICTSSDGTKLRDVYDETRTGSCVTWPIPNHPAQLLPLMPLDEPQNPSLTIRVPHLRMDYFDCNIPGITGYSAATNGDSVLAFHAHRAGEDVAFYSPVTFRPNDNISWIYMPIDPGEYVTRISVLDFYELSVSTRYIFQFVTNLGRTVTFGRSTGYPCKSRCNYSPVISGCRVYFNYLSSEIRDEHNRIQYLALEGTNQQISQKPEYTNHSVRFPHWTPYSDVPFHSSSPMTRVKKIMACRNPSPNAPFITGILIQRQGDSRACLGHVRFDWKLETIEAEDANGIYLVIGNDGYNNFVIDARLQLQNDSVDRLPPYIKDWTWKYIPFQGSVEWFWSSYSAKDYAGISYIRQSLA